MKIHQSMWKQWAIMLGLKILAHTTHTHPTHSAHFIFPFVYDGGNKNFNFKLILQYAHHQHHFSNLQFGGMLHIQSH